MLTSAHVVSRSLRMRPSASIKGSTLHPLTKSIFLHQTFQVSESSRMSHSHASSRGSQITSSTTYQTSSYGSWSTDKTRRFDLMYRFWTMTQAKVSDSRACVTRLRTNYKKPCLSYGSDQVDDDGSNSRLEALSRLQPRSKQVGASECPHRCYVI